MHSLQALALMQENRIASVGSLLMRSQRSPSSTDCPGSNGTSKVSQRAGSPSLPRRIFSVATVLTRHRLGWWAGESQRAFGEPHALMAPPGRQHLREIFALMGAAAFGPRQRGLCDRARNDEHVSQIEPFQPLQIEAGA